MRKKITTGWVTQTFDGKKCIKQEFTAGDLVEYDDADGNYIDAFDHDYQPFEMVQPSIPGDKNDRDKLTSLRLCVLRAAQTCGVAPEVPEDETAWEYCDRVEKGWSTLVGRIIDCLYKEDSE